MGAQVHVYDVGGDCSARIHEGREYVVATGQDQWGDHRISSCHLVREVMGPLPDDLKFLGEPQMRFDTTWTPAADEPSIQRVPMRQGGYGVPPNWQAGGMNGGLQSDWKLALVAGGSLLAAAAVALVGSRT